MTRSIVIDESSRAAKEYRDYQYEEWNTGFKAATAEAIKAAGTWEGAIVGNETYERQVNVVPLEVIKKAVREAAPKQTEQDFNNRTYIDGKPLWKKIEEVMGER